MAVTEGDASGTGRTARHPPTLATAWRFLLLAELLGLVVAMEYFFQPFVWRNWPVDEVLLGWLPILVDRAWVALLMAIAAWVALRVAWRWPLPAGGALFAIALAVAAVAGEVALRYISVAEAGATRLDVVVRALRWTAVGLATGALILAWHRRLRADELLRQAQQRRLAAEMQVADLRLQALQSQIEPHFLFNTLATARRLGGTDPAQCARLLEHLHDFVRLGRAATPGRMQWSLADELELVRAYLGVIELRMGERLRLRYVIDPDAGRCEVPPLALATLVENAVKHGITPCAEGGEITLQAHREPASGGAGALVLSVADTGVGFGAAASSGGTGIGLANTRARLSQAFGSAATLSLANNTPRGAIAMIRMPVLVA